MEAIEYKFEPFSRGSDANRTDVVDSSDESLGNADEKSHADLRQESPLQRIFLKLVVPNGTAPKFLSIFHIAFRISCLTKSFGFKMP